MMLVLHLTKLGVLIHQRIPDRPHRRLFLASVSFFITFLGVRLLVASITHHIGPFGYVQVGGRHIHHLVWGILLLLITGYADLTEVGIGDTCLSILMSRLLSIAYGMGAPSRWMNSRCGSTWIQWRIGRTRVEKVLMLSFCSAHSSPWAHGERPCFGVIVSEVLKKSCGFQPILSARGPICSSQQNLYLPRTP